MRNYKKFILILAILGILIGSTVLAKQELLVDWPKSPLGGELTENSNIGDLIMYIYQWGITLGGFALFIVLVIAGFQYLASAGNPATMKSAKDRIISAGIGIVVLLGSYLILYTINPQLTASRWEIQLPYAPIPEGRACKNPEDCCKGVTENYELCIRSYDCKNGVCVLKGIATLTPCQTVTVKWEEGGVSGEAYLERGEAARCADITTTGTGVHFTFEGSPEGCNSNLYFFSFEKCNVTESSLAMGVSVSLREATINFGVSSIGLDYPF